MNFADEINALDTAITAEEHRLHAAGKQVPERPVVRGLFSVKVAVRERHLETLKSLAAGAPPKTAETCQPKHPNKRELTGTAKAAAYFATRPSITKK